MGGSVFRLKGERVAPEGIQDERGMLPPDFLEQEEPMNKKEKKKPLFVIRETLVHLAPGEMGQVQGGGGCLDYPATCVFTW